MKMSKGKVSGYELARQRDKIDYLPDNSVIAAASKGNMIS